MLYQKIKTNISKGKVKAFFMLYQFKLAPNRGTIIN